MKFILCLLMISAFLAGCNQEQKEGSQQKSNDDLAIQQNNIQPDPYENSSSTYGSNSTSNDEPVANKDPLAHLRHEPVTTEEEIQNLDGSTTIRTTTTDGVNISTSEKTVTANSYGSNSLSSSDRYAFEEAYNYARKAYRGPDDVETAQNYLKKAMNYFSDAERYANNLQCQRAASNTSDGYSYAKKGYHSDSPDDIESYAKKAMNYAETALNELEDCALKLQRK
ncbi:hypothetical protein K2F45_06900 [Sphingobacterium siyangense]|uniref:hypothetical protein n=1 Tax=Sphingobacterium siyangense TaxID=459529 RepID=UPI00200ECA3E|nr:hypothetical protein [Sphingobacterium siyangense]UQA76715.1 hypothetical protein K2F45_06900 [Sphingobacterium siyangense]